MGTPHLTVDRITKTFGSIRANDRVSLRVERASVHAILGENGAGKTTLMNILYGFYQPDEGRIFLNGKEVNIDSPRQALQLGIGMVHQNFLQVGPFTVTENVVLGNYEGCRILNLAESARRLRELSDSFGFEIDPEEAVWKLPIGMQQRVEILKLLYRQADLLILDEPTSVLTPGEIEPFFAVLRRLRQAGKTILFVTHKLEEVMTLADHVTVMRNGGIADERKASETSPRELARLMVGRDVFLNLARNPSPVGRTVLEVEGLQALSDRGLNALDGVTFSVKEGEILGLAGVDGNGQSELAEALAGLRPLSGGRVRLNGEDMSHVSVAERKNKFRVAYVPEDRLRVGLVPGLSVAFNLFLRSYCEPPFAHRGILNLTAVREHARMLISQFDVRVRDMDQHVRELSGGNQQRLVLARELEGRPALLIVSQPCKGLDVGAIEFVQKALLEQRSRGAAILYISTELEHILAVSDRIAVLFRGRIAGLLTPQEATPERLGLLMAGAAGEEALCSD